MLIKIVIRYPDGRILKGSTADFSPAKSAFHMRVKDSGENLEIKVEHLKAIFFVKDFEGDRNYRKRNDAERVGQGRKISVLFKDGEMMVGYSHGFSRERVGFFLVPADSNSNNEKAFIVNAATISVGFAQ
ncbi:MAG: hypothetical protein WCL71_08605 [Deltaproteobacteria bacterium]